MSELASEPLGTAAPLAGLTSASEEGVASELASEPLGTAAPLAGLTSASEEDS